MTDTNARINPRKILNGLMVTRARNRAADYAAYILRPEDTKEQKIARGKLLHWELEECSRDVVRFVELFAWSPDTKDQFGSGAISKSCGDLVDAGLIPGGAVPIILFNKQKAVLRDFQMILEREGSGDMAVVKSRQVALTTILGGWALLWAWLFRPGCAIGVTSYDDDQVDRGGKGQREADSLFGRYRLFLDYMTGCVPALRFNQHLQDQPGRKKSQRGQSNPVRLHEITGMKDTEDISMKLVRPTWIVNEREIFKQAARNWIIGDKAGDSLFRGLTLTIVFMDELGQFNHSRAGVDRKSWAATNQNCKVRIVGGTIPDQGGPGSLFYDLMEDEDDLTTVRHWVHWTEMSPYLEEGAWVCRKCRHENPWSVAWGSPGRGGRDEVCVCGRAQNVTYKDMTSKWFKEQVSKSKGDKVAIARELQMDWMAAMGDTLFSNLPLDLVGPVKSFSGTGLIYEGIDPGFNIANPGAWMVSRLDPKTLELEMIGYWMGANNHTEYWVPFLKRWSSAQVHRMKVPYGKMLGGKTFQDAFQYPEEAHQMLDKVRDLLGAQGFGHIQGDNFGKNNQGEGSFYDGLSRYRIFVSNEYTSDREEFVKSGLEWGARIKLWEETCDIRPPSPLGGSFPSMKQCFMTAQPAQQQGEGRRKLDVSKKSPKHVHGGVDAFLYLAKGLNVEVHNLPDNEGDWGVEDGYAAGPSGRWGETTLGFG